MTETRRVLKPGDPMMTSMPGIALDFRAEILEIRSGDEGKSRVRVRALEPVLGYYSPEVVYEVGSTIWLHIPPPEGCVFDESGGESILPL